MSSSAHTALERLQIDLGANFDTRWKRASRALRRELIAEIRDLYVLLEDEDMPLLAGLASGKEEARPATATRPVQDSLFSATATTSTSASVSPSASAGASAPAGAIRPDNPFLPKSVLDRLQQSQQQATSQLRELMHKPSAPASSHEQVDLERELRLKLGPVIENLIESHMEQMRSELRVRLRAEMDRLISDHVRQR
ncbi:MAG: hypothetical protein Q8J78_04360 [Moraxellaceae bacterium]|nr:hypothetical protein [Moraxellaceae bacterium]